MKWSDMNYERDAEGNLTPLAIALDSISGNGCDCGEDEPGTCLACVCEAALKHLWHQLNQANSIASALLREKNKGSSWEVAK